MVRGTPACLDVRRVEEDLVAAIADPQRYASPARECDIVMKGGITSGVIYPLAVCELAGVYRLRNIGGTSAGAIAALFGFIANGLTVPGKDDTELIQALIAIPGAALALAASYLWGSRLDVAHGLDHGHTREGSV